MRIILQIAFMLSCNYCISQQFSTLYDYQNFSNDGSTIVRANDGYLCIHPATDLISWNLSTIVSLHNENGNLQWNYSLSNESEYFKQSVNGHSILSISSGNFFLITGNYYIAGNEIATPFLLKTLETGEIQDTVILDELHEFDLRVIGITLHDNFIYLLCNEYSQHNSFLIKCDLEGDIIEYSINYLAYAPGMLFVSNTGSGIVIGGRIVEHPNSDYWKQMVQKFDYEGNVLWTNIIDNNGLTNRGAVNALPMDNGNVLFASTYTGGEWLFERFQPCIGEINDITGDTLWTKRYFSADSIHMLLNFKRLSNGEYIGVGETRQPLGLPNTSYYLNIAYIFKLDSEFNLLWKRMYVPEGFAGIPWPEPTCRLNDFVENDDGGITALGRAFTYTGTGPQSGYIQDSWLLRVDSEGCLVSGCAVDITEYENEQYLFVYPNPANDKINIQLSSPSDVFIYTATGQLLETHTAKSNYQIDVSHYPAGLYLVVSGGVQKRFVRE